ncbi:MAG TPA: methyl-accepting chemotaxis protein, partial [Thermoanaerobaculia bacterium]|nr:methyl-accepting chemotaxis protein [Thermoanaerobaculia bacterium]
SFSRKYIIWLLVPPAVVIGPLSFIFLSQVIAMSFCAVSSIVGLFAVFFLLNAAVIWMGLTPLAEAVEEAVRHSKDASEAATRCLERTELLTLALWGAGSVLFAVVASLIVMPTALGFGYFFVSACIGAFPSVIWAYAAGKRLLSDHASHGGALRYTGRRFPLGRKIAIVFIGSFLISFAALVALISSKVSTTLEQLAIASASDRFQRVYDSANLSAKIDPGIVDTLREYVPSDYAVAIISKGGAMRTSIQDSLTPAEVSEIRRLGNGDSTAFISPHVARFARLKDGSILVLTVPWSPYQGIPRQITFYTIVIALFTLIAFVAAALFLSRDVAGPVRAIRALAADMAQGNFNTTARVFSDDEVGELAGSFGETRANLRRLLGRVGGSGSTITQGVLVITGGTESLLLRARDQSALTESSSLAVENVRGGIGGVLGAADTVTELTQDASSRALELQASSEEVARSMDYLFQSVEKTSSSTTEMNASMNEMSGRTEVLAGIGEEVLSFVAEMDSTIAELRASAQSTADISRQVREDAEAGGGAVAKTVDGINISRDVTNSTAETLDDLQRSVGQINQIVNVIEEITNRTNLLALNAAIIAAQAGEHGRGFTVVADEIRELAERTRGSTKEISAIVKAVQSGSKQAATKMQEGVRRVEDNVRLADDASTSLAKIVGSAAHSYEMATKISRALEDQAQASRHLHEVASRMSDHIAEINRASREQARGTQLLAVEADRVREIAAQVRNATDEQSLAGRGITAALEKIAEDARAMRDSLDRQLRETDRIADASKTMLDIAQANDAIAREFNTTVQSLVTSGKDFESEVARFRFTES